MYSQIVASENYTF